jgi:D-apionolactonase
MNSSWSPTSDEQRAAWRGLSGTDTHPTERIPLRAGPVTLVLEGGDLREISAGPHELVRRIYGAVRDRDWGTVPGVVSHLSIASRDDSFTVSHVSTHQDREIDFVWQARIDGHADGRIEFAFSGVAQSSFSSNRIGLCTLHPIRECAGLAARARYTEGRHGDVSFPALVAEKQPITGFTGLTALRYDIHGITVALEFDGDIFETEDQRNWIDASYKTYSRPLALPRPIEIVKGTRIEQRVTVRVRVPYRPTRPQFETAALIRFDSSRGRPVITMPAIGVGLGHAGAGPDLASSRHLRSLRPAHLRIDLRLEEDWRTELEGGLAASADAECPLEIAVHVGERSGAPLHQISNLLPAGSVARWLVFAADRMATTPGALSMVREHLMRSRPAAEAVGTGANGDLYQFHLHPPPAADFFCWGMNPHAHASDLTSLAETPPAAADQVRSLARRLPGARIALTPITLQPRGAAVIDPDPLHGSLFGAAWTLALAASVADAGLWSATFYHRLDAIAPATGRVSPLYHVLADLAECAGAPIVPLVPREDWGWVMTRSGAGSAVLLIANLARETAEVRLPIGFTARRIRILDLRTRVEAIERPEAFRAASHMEISGEALAVPAFGTARVDGVLIGAR